MNDDRLDGDLLAEVERYLAAVEVFRAERCEPTWLGAGGFQPDSARARAHPIRQGVARARSQELALSAALRDP